MYNKMLRTATLALTLALSPAVFANSMGCGEGLKEMVSSLKLDDGQKSKIKPILEQFKSTAKDNASQMKDLEQQMNQQAESASMDESTVDSLIDKKTKLIGNIMKAKVVAKNQIYTVLNPQQKAELQNKMKKMEEKISEQYKSCQAQD